MNKYAVNREGICPDCNGDGCDEWKTCRSCGGDGLAETGAVRHPKAIQVWTFNEAPQEYRNMSPFNEGAPYQSVKSVILVPTGVERPYWLADLWYTPMKAMVKTFELPEGELIIWGRRL